MMSSFFTRTCNKAGLILFMLLTCISLPTLAQWQPNGATSGNIYYNGGNVGIGTSSPNSILQINSWANSQNLQTARQLIISGDNWGGLGLDKLGAPEHKYGLEIGYHYNYGQSTKGGRIQACASGGVSLMLNPDGGNVGIGTTNPERKLDVSGITRTTHTEFYEGTNWCGFIGRGGSYTGGWSSIPDALTLSYAGRDFAIGGWGTDGIWRGCSLFINANNGNIGMGTISPGNYKLNVAGKIRADEIVVNTDGADFVFEPTYKLRTLSELETFIRTNKHLPDIAPAKEMQENGISAGEMHAKLLQKVEELTLYVIEQQKTIELQNQRINQLEQKLNQ